MHGSAAQAAMGVIVAALAVAALAAQRGGDNDVAFVASAAHALEPARAPAAPTVAALRDGQRLDLNQASAEQLRLLPGVGTKLAQRIVAERQRRGRYSTLEELRAVRGVGPKTWARIQPFLQVDHKSNK